MPYVILGAIAVILAIWVISARRTLAMLDENINNAMSRIGVLLAGRWDALSALMDLTRGYAEYEYSTLSKTIQLRRPITSESAAQEAAAQENLLIGAIARIMAVAEQSPDLKANDTYAKTMDSVNRCEGMVRQSRLVYNDSVTKLNRQIRVFPTSLVAGMLGFGKRDYLEANDTTHMPGITDMAAIHIKKVEEEL